MNLEEALNKLEKENIIRCDSTIRGWIRDGKLKATLREGKKSLGYEIAEESLDELINKMKTKKEIRRCEVKSCRKKAQRKGYCHTHYSRLLKHGSTQKPKRKVIRRTQIKKKCSIEECENYVESNNFCPTHSYNYKTYGDPLYNDRIRTKGLKSIVFMDFKGKKVAFESQVRTRYDLPSSKSNIIRNYKNQNKDTFIEGVHFVRVYSKDLEELRSKYENEVYSFKALSPKMKMVNMYTEQGVEVIVDFLKSNNHLKEDEK